MGIGLGIAYRLAEAGAQVAVADIEEEAAASAAKQLVADGFDAIPVMTGTQTVVDGGVLLS